MAQAIIKNLARQEINTFFGMVVFKDLYDGKSRKEVLALNKKDAKDFMAKVAKKIVDEKDAKKELKEYYSDNRPVVVDGQQRLTTLLLGCGVLRKIFMQWGNTTAKFEGKKKDEWIKALDEICLSEGEFRFKISGEDYEHATNYCADPVKWPEGGKWPKPGKQNGYWPVQSATTNMFKIWNQWIKQKSAGANQRKALGQLANAVCNEVELVLVTVNSDLQAHIVFNSLNTTGESLTKGELISSYIRLKALDFDRTTQRKAKDIVEDIIKDLKADNTEDFDILSDFYLRHWISRFGYIGMDDLFTEYEAKISPLTKNQFKSELDKLKSSVTHYIKVNSADIAGQEEDLWDYKSAGMRQHIPLFMAALAAEFDESDLADLFKVTRIFVARYMIAGLGSGRGRVLDSEWGAWSKLVTNNKERAIRTISNSITDQIKEHIERVNTDNDTTFETYLKEAAMSRGQAKLLLRQEYQDAFPGTYSSSAWEAEHIAPESHTRWPDSGWTEIDGKRLSDKLRTQYKNRLGNYIIVRKDLNRTCSNKGWKNRTITTAAGKRRTYRGKHALYRDAAAQTESGKKETQQFKDFVAEIDKKKADSTKADWAQLPWNLENIVERTRVLAEPLKNAFPMSDL
jgi:hypothetical protein